MTLISKDRLMDFLADEAAARMGLMKPDDPPTAKIADLAFLQGIEVVASYVEEVAKAEAAA